MMRWWYWGCLVWLLMGCTFELDDMLPETQVVYLPVIEMVATPTPTSTPSVTPTDTLLPTLTPMPTWTPNPHPYMQHQRWRIPTENDLYTISRGDLGERVYVGVEPWIDTPAVLPVERFEVLTHTVLMTTKPFLAHIVADAKRDRLYVGSQWSNNVITVFENGELIGEVPLSGALLTMTLEPKKGWLYVITGTGGAGVVVLDGAEILVEDTTIDFGPRHIAIDPNSDYVYMGGNFLGLEPDDSRPLGRIVVFDGLEKVAVFERIGTIMKSITSMVVHPDTGNLYAKTLSTGVYDDYNFYTIRGDEFIAATNMSIDEDGNRRIGYGGGKLLIHPHSKKLYWLNSGTTKVTILTADDVPVEEKVIELPSFTRTISMMEADPITGNLYLLDSKADTIHVIHDEEVIGELRADNPGAMAVNPTNGFVYVIGTEDRVTDDLYIYGWEGAAPTAVPTPENDSY